MKIMREGENYTGQMGMYPVMNLTLKSAKQRDVETAYYMIQTGIASEFERHRSIVEEGKERLSGNEYERYIAIAEEKAEEKEVRNSLCCFAGVCTKSQGRIRLSS